MKKLWIFGDSFSAPYEHPSNINWSNKYIEWKGYSPNIFSKLLSNNLNLELHNLALGASSNSTIFETIYTNAHNINKGDIVIIGWSSQNRFRLSNIKKEWTNIVPNYTDTYKNELPFISKTTLDEILSNRSDEQYLVELFKKINFINWLFKESTIIHWSMFNSIINNKIIYDPNHSITAETNSLINDKHYSEAGHIILYNNFLDIIKTPNSIKII